jgi:hypothetical protein
MRDEKLPMSLYRAAMVGLALLTAPQVGEASAQTLPILGYVAAKNANPKRLEVFKKGLAEFGNIEGEGQMLNTIPSDSDPKGT